MRKLFCLLALSLWVGILTAYSSVIVKAGNSCENALRIIPAPLKVSPGQGYFYLQRTTHIIAKGKDVERIAVFFAEKLRNATGYSVRVGRKAVPGSSIELRMIPGKGNPEAYTLDVTPGGVIVESIAPQGLFYGMQSFMQLLPPQVESTVPQSQVEWKAPVVHISDAPRFGYRSIMLDVCRHFMPVETIKKQIDVLSLFKINNIHWHLTDDQGWRIEIKKYPKLTQYGAWRTEGDGSRYGGYYTQEEIKEVVEYAQKHFINIIPELELPGHGLAAIAAYPELSCRGDSITPRIVWGVEDVVMCPGKESTFHFLENVIKEMVPLFPGKYFHIGGDECPRTEWEKCPLCQQRMTTLGYKDEPGKTKEAKLQSYVVRRIEKVLARYGKSIIGWDEILEGGGLKSSTVIMSWRGEEGGIAGAKAGHGVIMSPSSHGLYLNFYQDDPKVAPVAIGGNAYMQRTYAYNPIPESLQGTDKEKFIIGVQGNVWTEYILNEQMLEYSLYPQALTVAEIGWSQPERKNFDSFVKRVERDGMLRLVAHKVNYHIPIPQQKNGSCDMVAFTDTVTLDFTTVRPEKLVYTTNGEQPDSFSHVYEGPLQFTHSADLKIASILPCGLMSPVRTIRVEKQTLLPPVTLEDTVSGLNLMVTKGKFMRMGELARAKDWSYKTIQKLSEIRSQTHVPGNVRNVEHYGAIAYGYLDIPQDGVYYFSSNNTAVWIDGRLIVNNDDELVKRYSRNDGSCALKKGLHAIRVMFLGHIGGGWPTYWDSGNVLIRYEHEPKFKIIAPDMLFR